MTTRCTGCGLLRWVSLSAAAFFLLAIIFSLFATALWAPETQPSGLQSVVLARGSVTVTYGNYLNFGGDPARWQIFRGTLSSYHWQWSPIYRHASMANSSQLILPLWIPAATFGALSVWLLSRGQPVQAAGTAGDQPGGA